jgi:PAS domain S-box-containing protein
VKSDWKWDSLDPREREVAELLMQGQSNAAISAEVYLSKARVQDSIKRILIKTGTDSTRGAIALLVAERHTLVLLGVLDQARAGLAIVQDRVVRFANMAMQQMYGYNLEEIMGMPFVELIAPRSRGAVVRQHELRLKGEPFSTLYVIRILCKGGQEKEVVVANAGQIEYKGRTAILITITAVPHVGEE